MHNPVSLKEKKGWVFKDGPFLLGLPAETRLWGGVPGRTSSGQLCWCGGWGGEESTLHSGTGILHCTALGGTGSWNIDNLQLYICTFVYSNVLYCSVLHCTYVHCTGLNLTFLHCIFVHCTVWHCTILHCTVLHYTTLHCTVLHYTVLYCTALHCTVLLFPVHWGHSEYLPCWGPSSPPALWQPHWPAHLYKVHWIEGSANLVQFPFCTSWKHRKNCEKLPWEWSVVKVLRCFLLIDVIIPTSVTTVIFITITIWVFELSQFYFFF